MALYTNVTFTSVAITPSRLGSLHSCISNYYYFHQPTVEIHPIQSMACYNLMIIQQKDQWWCSNVTWGLSQRERWQQNAGLMVSGALIQAVWPATLAQHPPTVNCVSEINMYNQLNMTTVLSYIFILFLPLFWLIAAPLPHPHPNPILQINSHPA